MKVLIWWNFTWAVESRKFCTLMGFFCPNHVQFQLKKVLKSYFWWHWRVIQGLKKNWLVVSNMTKGIWIIFTQPLKSLNILLQRAFFVKSMKVWDKKIKRSYLSWHWTVMQNLNKTLTLWFQNWHEDLGELSSKHFKIWKFVLWLALFVQSVMF